jgi:hypothetical protein
MSGFVQIIEIETSRIDEVRKLSDKFVADAQAQGRTNVAHSTITADRDHPGHYLNIVEFPSYEVAMENSERADTSEFAAKLAELCDGPPKYRNLDILQTLKV